MPQFVVPFLLRAQLKNKTKKLHEKVEENRDFTCFIKENCRAFWMFPLWSQHQKTPSLCPPKVDRAQRSGTRRWGVFFCRSFTRWCIANILIESIFQPNIPCSTCLLDRFNHENNFPKSLQLRRLSHGPWLVGCSFGCAGPINLANAEKKQIGTFFSSTQFCVYAYDI